MERLTFKQYLDSKENLRKAIERTPVVISEYVVKKYCSIVVGDNEEEKNILTLKPKQKLVIEWRYDNIEQPVLVSLKTNDPKTLIEEEFTTFWTTKKVQRWLSRHTNEEHKHGFKQ